MDIKDRIRLIREGEALEDLDVAFDEDEEEFLKETALEFFLSETENVDGYMFEAAGGASLVDLIKQSSEAEKSKDASAWQKVKTGYKAYMSTLPPSKILKDLKLVNQLTTTRGSYMWFGNYAMITRLFSRARAIGGMDAKTAKEYKSEALKFKKELEKRVSELSASSNFSDKRKVAKLKKNIAKLEFYIGEFDRLVEKYSN